MSDTDETVEQAIERLANEEETEFLVIEEFEEVTPEKPLYLLIHPGDVVQTPEDVAYSGEFGQRVLEYSRRCQEIMGAELMALDAETWDIAVLHRMSSEYAFSNLTHVDYWYGEGVFKVSDDATVLWGDDLDAASAYLVEALRVHERPLVVIAGAWSEAKHGCVAAVGAAIEAAGAKVCLSEGACISPDGSDEEWAPKVGKMPSQEIKAWQPEPAGHAP